MVGLCWVSASVINAKVLNYNAYFYVACLPIAPVERGQFIPASSALHNKNVFISKYFPLEHPATTATTSSRAERKLIINTFYCQESIIELQSAVNGYTPHPYSFGSIFIISFHFLFFISYGWCWWWCCLLRFSLFLLQLPEKYSQL